MGEPERLRSALREYVRATGRHIYLLLVGALGAILSVVGIVVPAVVQIVGFFLLAMGLLGAQFLAWREMRGERDQASIDLESARQEWNEREVSLLAKLDVREKRKGLRDALGEFFAQGEEVRAWIERGGEAYADASSGEGYVWIGTRPRDRDDESVRGSLERAEEWEGQVASFLAQYLGNTYVAQFRSLIGTTEREAPKLGSTKHAEAWAMVDRRLQVLVSIIKEAGEDLIAG